MNSTKLTNILLIIVIILLFFVLGGISTTQDDISSVKSDVSYMKIYGVEVK